MNGILNILKPSNMTSHDIVSFIRRITKIKKVGHTGTLDPNAAGVLPICIGKGTKIIEYLNQDNKKYRAELTLGYSTDTQDKYGCIIHEGLKSVTNEEIYKVFETFKGTIEQIPPMYSAIKHKGKKLYELAREGITVKRDARKVNIYDMKIININQNKILFDVECSKGTYIRTLCNDIGEKLGTYGHMSFLIRTQVGCFSLNDSYTIEELDALSSEKQLLRVFLPVDYPLRLLNSIDIDESQSKMILNGGKIPLNKINIQEDIYSVNKIIRVYYKGNFVGIGNILYNDFNEKYLKMEKVLF